MLQVHILCPKFTSLVSVIYTLTMSCIHLAGGYPASAALHAALLYQPFLLRTFSVLVEATDFHSAVYSSLLHVVGLLPAALQSGPPH